MTDSPRIERRSPLHDWHEAHGAKFGSFGGWWMPLDYAASGQGGGVLAEHAAVRERVGLFDVSHLGTIAVAGPGARSFLDTCLTADLGGVRDGRGIYTLCCDDRGGVIDDLLAYVDSADHVLLVPNAANAAEVAARLSAAAPAGVQVHDRHADFAVLAVAGPGSVAVLESVGLAVDLPYLGFTRLAFGSQPVLVARSGYTGERTYELITAATQASELWEALADGVAAHGGRPCGLAARDTLRTEMGYPLHGHELSLDITPVQAGLTWAIAWDKPLFWGREALVAEREVGPARRLTGLVAEERAIPRAGMAVRDDGGQSVGVVTSGTFSPTLGAGIGLALVAPTVSEGGEVTVDVRGRAARMRVQRPPFVPSRVS